MNRMKKSRTLGLALSILLFVACDKDDEKTLKPFPDGVYKGTFKRHNIPGSATAEVTITFNYPNWNGTSNIANYPAICNGIYNYENYQLKFSNKCFFTADFDWTLILDGGYIDRIEGDSLVFSKSYGDGAVDVYRLKKQ